MYDMYGRGNRGSTWEQKRRAALGIGQRGTLPQQNAAGPYQAPPNSVTRVNVAGGPNGGYSYEGQTGQGANQLFDSRTGKFNVDVFQNLVGPQASTGNALQDAMNAARLQQLVAGGLGGASISAAQAGLDQVQNMEGYDANKILAGYLAPITAQKMQERKALDVSMAQRFGFSNQGIGPQLQQELDQAAGAQYGQAAAGVAQQQVQFNLQKQQLQQAALQRLLDVYSMEVGTPNTDFSYMGLPGTGGGSTGGVQYPKGRNTFDRSGGTLGLGEASRARGVAAKEASKQAAAARVQQAQARLNAVAQLREQLKQKRLARATGGNISKLAPTSGLPANTILPDYNLSAQSNDYLGNSLSW